MKTGLDHDLDRRSRWPSTSRRARCRSAPTSTSATANACMKKGLKTPRRSGEHHAVSRRRLITADTINQIHDLLNEFFTDAAMTAEQAQAEFADDHQERAKQ